MVPILEESQGQKRHKLISWGHWFTASNILLAVIVSAFYFYGEPMPGNVSGNLYLIINLIGHMAFVTFIVYVLLVFPVTLLFPDPRIIRGLASVVFTTYLVLLVVDIYSYNYLGYHILTSDFGRVLSLLYESYVEQPGQFIAVSAVVIGIALGYQLTASNYLWRRREKFQDNVLAPRLAKLFIGLFFCSHLIHIWADATFNLEITRQDNVLPFSYPTTAKRLLSKYGLLDSEAYFERKKQTFEVDKKGGSFPDSLPKCTVNQTRDVAIIVTPSGFSAPQGNNWQTIGNYATTSHGEQGILDILYSVPRPYQGMLINQNRQPSLKEVMQDSLLISDNHLTPKVTEFFNQRISINQADVSQLSQQLLFVYATNDNQHKVQALTDELAGKGRLIFVVQIDPAPFSKRSIGYSPLYVANAGNTWQITAPVSHFDIMPSVLSNCDSDTLITTGAKIQDKASDDFVINKSDGTLLIYQKDKVIMVDQQGSIKSYSTTFGTRLDERDNLSLLIDAMKVFNKYQ